MHLTRREQSAREHAPAVRSNRWPFAISLAFGIAVECLAIAQISRWDGFVNADGVSYLDLAARFSNGDVGAIANGYWSPLYPALLALAERIARTICGPRVAELKVAFTTNAIILGLAALLIGRLFTVLVRDARDDGARSVYAMRAMVAGALAIWCLIRMIGTTTITPDALLAVITFLTSAEIALAVQSPTSHRRQYAFGALLGIGYWAKAVFLPVAVIAVVAYGFAPAGLPRRRILARCAFGLLVIAAPLVAVQSISQRHLSFGETGRLNYRWYVGGADHSPVIHEAAALTRARRSASAVAIEAAPGSVLFTGNVAGSFPYWFDPSRFEPPGFGSLSLGAQWRAITISAHWLRVTAGAFALLSVIALFTSIGRGRTRWRNFWICAPPAAMLALYALSHPEGRMGAASIACILLATITVTSAGPGRLQPRLLVAECVALGALATLLLERTVAQFPGGAPSTASSAALTSALRANGIGAGAEVGVIGTPYGQYWAHATDARIIVAIAPQDGEQRVLDDALLAEVARESAVRGYPLAAVLWRDPVRVNSSAAISVADGWHVWRERRVVAR